MKNKLYIKCKSCDFKQLFEKKGYVYFEKGNYNMNIIGVRSNQNNKVTNKYDDCLVLIYNTDSGWKRQIYNITTEPGFTIMKAPSNAKGTAILAPGQYRGAYKIDKHNGKYDALCQRNKVVKIYRDNNRDEVYDYKPETIDTGMFGINIHKAGTFSKRVDTWSAGCQVLASETEFRAFMNYCDKQIKYGHGDTFTYTLLKEEDLV